MSYFGNNKNNSEWVRSLEGKQSDFLIVIMNAKTATSFKTK